MLVKVIILIKNRNNLRDDFDNFKGPLIELIGSEEIVNKVKADADISMGVTLSDTDVIHIQELGNCINDMLL
jgi:RNA processing factor Prp31